MDISPVEWVLTLVVVTGLIGFDLWKNRKPHEVSMKEAAWGTLVWTLIGLSFTLVVLAFNGVTTAGEYLTGYLLERTLSLDNVFVFVIILSYFAVPVRLQHQALMFGIIAALVLRAIFIFVGAGLLEAFDWMVYVFGGFLVYTAAKLATSGDEEVDPDKNIALKLLRKVVPVSNDYEGHKLLTTIPGTTRRAVTPLFAVLLVLGTTDVVFAVDSIPAIFAALREPEPYLVFSANAFALLGLLPMTFLVASSVKRFKYLKHALALVLALVGVKMIATGLHFHVNTWVSLIIILLVLVGGIAFSLFKTRNEPPDEDILHEQSSQ